MDPRTDARSDAAVGTVTDTAMDTDMDTAVVDDVIGAQWRGAALEPLREYVAIPALSPMFDASWEERGAIARATALLHDWAQAREIAGMRVDVHRLDGRTPVLTAVVPAFGRGRSDRTVLLYGHLDKQPELSGWRNGLGPWDPVLEGERLYGRGGADDGYSVFAALGAIEAVQAAGGSHDRCVVLIEASEESGSPDLSAHVQALLPLLATPYLVVCLDSWALDYERLWVTTSLRGLVGGTLRVDVLTEGVHSGAASGIVPSSFRVLRQLLDRVEDARTGAVLVDACHVPIPEGRIEEARRTAAEVGALSSEFPLVEGVQPMTGDALEQILNRTWRPTLSVTGAAGMPGVGSAGNVLRASTSLRLSFRLPPTADAQGAMDALRRVLLADPPSGAHVELLAHDVASGWEAPGFAPWLLDALDDASRATFGRGHRAFGEGGTIPFMGMLSRLLPDAQFVVTGVLGPHSNAHGPNEFLHLPTAARVSGAVARLLDRAVASA